MPCEDNLLRLNTLARPTQRVSRFEKLPGDIERSLLEIFEKEINLQRTLDALKRDLEYRYDYTPMAAFRSIDKHNYGRIDTYVLGTFLRS